MLSTRLEIFREYIAKNIIFFKTKRKEKRLEKEICSLDETTLQFMCLGTVHIQFLLRPRPQILFGLENGALEGRQTIFKVIKGIWTRIDAVDYLKSMLCVYIISIF